MTTRYKRTIRHRIADYKQKVRVWWLYHSDSFLCGVAAGVFSIYAAYIVVVNI